MRANRPEKSGGGARNHHTPQRTCGRMKNKKKAARKREEAEARARGELKDDSESESEEEEYEEEPAPKQKSASKKRKAAEEAEDEDDDDDDSAGEDSEEEVPANRDRPRIKVDFTGVNAKEKTLILSSRGVTSRYRHLMLDFCTMMPNSKKDAKLDTKNPQGAVVEVADMKSCTGAMFFECRKRTDCYMWLSKCPQGPSVKFYVENVHTMAELKLTGNHLKFSRPVLHFDASFDDKPHLRLIKEMLTHTFATPYRHHKMKPFIDHIFAFYWEDGRVWFRNYQIVHPEGKEVRATGLTLSEAGPRLCLQPIKIFQGAFGGPTLYEDPAYVSPNIQRREQKKQDMGKYARKVQKKAERKAHARMNALKPDELDGWAME